MVEGWCCVSGGGGGGGRLGRGGREEGSLGCVSAMRVRCVPRVCAALCVVCCAVRSECVCVCVCVFVVFVCGFEWVVRVCVWRERWSGRGDEEERVCGGGKGGDGHLHMHQFVDAMQ